MQLVSKAFKDKPMLPKDLAVWWTEYIAKHQGGPRLRSPAADITWIEFLNLDIIVALHLTLFLVYCLIKMLFRKICCILFSDKKEDKLKLN